MKQAKIYYVVDKERQTVEIRRFENIGTLYQIAKQHGGIVLHTYKNERPFFYLSESIGVKSLTIFTETGNFTIFENTFISMKKWKAIVQLMKEAGDRLAVIIKRTKGMKILTI